MVGRTAAFSVAIGLVLAVTPARAIEWRPHFGVEAGGNLARLPEDPDFLGDERWSAGGTAALLARWDCAPLAAIEFAPGWQRQKGRLTGSLVFGPAQGDFETRLQFDRIVFPVRVVLHPRRGGPVLEGGVVPAWNAHVDYRSEISDFVVSDGAARALPGPVPSARIFEGLSFDPDWTSEFHRWGGGVTAGMGWDRALTREVLRVRVRWQQDLFDLAKSGRVTRLSSLSATVGLLW